ncbi:MAG TPA: Fic family protein [Chitinophagaceae bacterium]
MKKLEPAPSITLINFSRSAIKLLISEEVMPLINKINEEYYYWDKVKYQPLPEGLTHAELWSLVSIRRRNTPYNISFGKYKFHWNLNSRLSGLLHFLDMNIGGSLESSSIINKEDKNRYLLSSIMEEAIASSQIEGAVTTRKHAKEMLRKNIKPRTKSEQMIYNNYITIQKILSIKSEPLTLENLLHVHKLVTTNTLSSDKEEGFIRDDDEIKVIDTIDGTVVHNPPPVKELKKLLNDLFRFFNEDDPKLFIHPVTKACIVHFMIGFIHPFIDGNGRTARALFYWYLLKKEYWLIEYLSISRLILKSKASYAMAFLYTETDDNDLTYFISYNLRTMKLAFEELREYIKRKNEQKKQLTDFLGIDGITYRQALILEWYREEADLLLTVNEAEKRLGVSYMTARTDLNELTTKGYLQARDMNKKSKGYVRGKGFETLLSRPKRKRKFGVDSEKNSPTLFD